MTRRLFWRDAILGYGLPSAAAAAATLTWFTPGRFFAAGDVAPYLRASLVGELTSQWNHQVTGAGSVSYAIIRLPDVVLLAVADALGATPMLAQRVLYLLVAALSAFGAAYLAGAWVPHPMARAVAGLLGAFNAFVLVNYPNPLPALAIGLTGVLAGLILRAARGRRIRPIVLAAASLPLCYVAQNPPLLVVVAVGVLAASLVGAALAGPGAGGRVGRTLVGALAWAVPLHLWWLVVYALSIFGGAGATFSAQTDVLAWSWSHVRSSLGNVLTLNGQWGWTDTALYPYAPTVDGGLGSVLRWSTPALALAGLVGADRPRRRAAWLLGGGCLMAAAVATGTHPPLGGLNLWLFQHVPGMWLFRDPMSKLGVPLVLGYATLAALAIERLLESTSLWRPTLVRRAAALIVVVAAVAYPYPLWTGAVAAGPSGSLPGDRVAVPEDWYRVAGLLNADPAGGKVLILPLDAQYQVDTAWGYHGVDEVPAQLFQRPVLRRLPGGYFDAGGAVDTLLDGVQRSLLDGDAAAAAALLRTLGVSHVVVRRDLQDSPYLARPADPGRIAATLRALPGVEQSAGAVAVMADTPVGALLRVSGDTTAMRAEGRLVRVEGDGSADVAAAVAGLGGADTVTADPRLPADEVFWQSADPDAAGTITVDHDGHYTAHRSDQDAATFTAAVTVHSGGAAAIDLTDAEAMSVDGIPLPARPPLSIPLAWADPVVLTAGSAAPVDPRGGVVTVGTATPVTAYGIDDGSASLLGDLAPGIDCAPDGDDPAPVTARARPSGCLSAPVRMVGSGTVRIRLSYRVVGDAAGSVCLWQEGPDRCAEVPGLSAAPAWRTYLAVANVDRRTTGLSLRLRSGGTGESTVDFRDVEVDGLRPIGQAQLTAEPAPPVTLDLSAGPHRVVRRGPAADSGAGAVLTPCPQPAGCLRTAETDATAGRYLVTLEFRLGDRARARTCVWLVGPDRCADQAALPVGSGWQRFVTTVQTEPGTRRLALYLYADGLDGRPAAVSYRDVRLRLAAAAGLRLTDPAGPSQPPGFSVTSTGLYHAQVRNARGSFVLTLDESYAQGWRVTGLPAGWHASHFQANGYANGWLITGTGDASIAVDYAPEFWSRAAIAVSVTSAAAAALWLLARGRLARVRSARRRRRLARGGPAGGEDRGGAPPLTAAQRVDSPAAGPLVSIIVPTRNAADLMRSFLASCATSTYRNIEIVMNDDWRSTDRLSAVAARFAAEGLPVTYLRENHSMAQGRSAGALHSRGDILLHLDADMELAPDLVAECVALIGAGADALVVPEESFGTTFWADCKWLEKRCYAGVTRIESARVFTRGCYEAVGGHNPRLVFSEDKDLDLRVRAAGYRISRTRTALRHNEGHLTLRRALAKKWGYSGTAHLFAELHPEQFAWQANVLHRYALYLRHVDQLFVHPLRYLGLLFLKTAECGAVAVGSAWRWRPRRPSGGEAGAPDRDRADEASAGAPTERISM